MQTEMDVQCYIGKLLDETCCTDDSTNSNSVYNCNSITPEYLCLLEARVENFDRNFEGSICDNHFKQYGSNYASRENFCYNPYLIHKKKYTSRLSVLQLDECKKFNVIKYLLSGNEKELIPGKKICNNCKYKVVRFIESSYICSDPFKKHRICVRSNLFLLDTCLSHNLSNHTDLDITTNKIVCKKCLENIQQYLNEKYTENKANVQKQNVTDQALPITNESGKIDSALLSSTKNTPDQPVSTQTSEYISNSQDVEKLNTMLEVIGVPPLKRQKLCDDRFIDKAIECVQIIVNKVMTQIAKAYDIKLPVFANLTTIQSNLLSFDSLVNNLKEAYNKEDKTFKKIALLTVVPDDWSFQKTYEYFKCSRYMYSQARRLKNDKGKILYFLFILCRPLRPYSHPKCYYGQKYFLHLIHHFFYVF